MKKTILIAIFVLICNCSPILAADDLQPETDAPNNQAPTSTEAAVLENNTAHISYPLKERTKNILMTGQEMAAQVFTKDTIMYVSVSIGFICYVTLCLTCDLFMGVFQLIQWGVTKVSSLAH